MKTITIYNKTLNVVKRGQKNWVVLYKEAFISKGNFMKDAIKNAKDIITEKGEKEFIKACNYTDKSIIFNKSYPDKEIQFKKLVGVMPKRDYTLLMFGKLGIDVFWLEKFLNIENKSYSIKETLKEKFGKETSDLVETMIGNCD